MRPYVRTSIGWVLSIPGNEKTIVVFIRWAFGYLNGMCGKPGIISVMVHTVFKLLL